MRDGEINIIPARTAHIMHEVEQTKSGVRHILKDKQNGFDAILERLKESIKAIREAGKEVKETNKARKSAYKDLDRMAKEATKEAKEKGDELEKVVDSASLGG